MLTAQVRDLGPRFGFLEYADDLCSRKSVLHCHSFVNELYIDTVLITGNRSGSAEWHDPYAHLEDVLTRREAPQRWLECCLVFIRDLSC